MPEVWPFRPMTGESSETLEWLTDTLPGYTGEQRIALRPAPRQFFDYTARLDAAQFARAKALARRMVGTTLYAPVWIEAQYVGAVGSGDTSVSITTTAGDWRVGSPVLVWEEDDAFSTVTIDAIGTSPGSLTFTGAVGTAYTRAWVVPLRTAFAPNGFRVSRFATVSDVAVRLQVTDNEDLSADGALADQYQSLDVMVDAPVAVADVNESIVKAAEYVDNGFGPVAIELAENYVRGGFMASFADETQADLWARRTWLHKLRGRQKPFWMPAFNMDLQLTVAITSLATVVTVETLGAASAYTGRHVMLELNDGTRFFRAITNASIGATTDNVTLSSAIGQDVAIADVKRFTFLNKCRLDSDQVTISYRTGFKTAFSVPVVEVSDA